MTVWDCMTYNGEEDVLALRLEETKDVVDRWMIVECTHTHQGSSKPKTLWSDKRVIEKYGDRVAYALVPPRGTDPDGRERSQREDVGISLERWGVQPDDLVHVSDLDEITSASTFQNYRAGMGLRSVAHRLSYYWINCVGGTWGAAKIGLWSDFQTHGGNTHWTRFLQQPPANGGGWHCSYLGGPSGIKAKLESFLHSDLNLPHYKDERHLRICRATGIDLFLRYDMDFNFVPLDDSFPRPVLDGKFPQLVADCPGFDWVMMAKEQIMHLCWTCSSRVSHLEGAVVEIGSWEGRSSVALANACYPDVLHCIDLWEGSVDGAAPKLEDMVRGVEQKFARNAAALTPGNVRMVKGRSPEALSRIEGPIKFAHIDGGHKFEEVRDDILACKARLVPGGVLCGDDLMSAHAGRADLNGGVERAVNELLPGHERLNNFWIWQDRR